MATINARNISRLYLECLNEGRLGAADEVIAPSFSVNTGGKAPGGLGADGFKELVVTRMRAGFPDLHFTLDDVLSDGDRVVVRWTMTGKQQGPYMGIAPTGKSVALTAIAIYRMIDGRAVEQWSVVDRLGLLQQLGVTSVP
jgi:predicted ester cyclase